MHLEGDLILIFHCTKVIPYATNHKMEEKLFSPRNTPYFVNYVENCLLGKDLTILCRDYMYQ